MWATVSSLPPPVASTEYYPPRARAQTFEEYEACKQQELLLHGTFYFTHVTPMKPAASGSVVEIDTDQWNLYFEKFSDICLDVEDNITRLLQQEESFGRQVKLDTPTPIDLVGILSKASLFGCVEFCNVDASGATVQFSCAGSAQQFAAFARLGGVVTGAAIRFLPSNRHCDKLLRFGQGVEIPSAFVDALFVGCFGATSVKYDMQRRDFEVSFDVAAKARFALHCLQRTFSAVFRASLNYASAGGLPIGLAAP